MTEQINQVTKKRVVCLYRVSTVGQVDKDDIPMQKQYCREFSQRQSGWEIVKEFSEKGVSGFKISAKDRDAIQEIQRMALQGEFDILLVFMFDRLGRKDDETPFVVEWFVKQNIEVWSAMEGQQRFDSHVDKLLNYIRYWQASGESIKTAMRVKTRMIQMAEEGLYTGGAVPFGYRAEKRGRMNKKNHDVRDLVVDPEEAELVKQIFQKYVIEGYGATRISQYFQEEGIRRKDGRAITAASVRHVIRNPICIGILRFAETKSEVLPELKIIDESLFLQAQEIYEGRSHHRKTTPLSTKGKYLLIGNVYCGCCGARLSTLASGRKYKRKDGSISTHTYYRYSCYNQACYPRKCNGQGSYGIERIDNLVDQIVRIQLAQIKQAPPQALLKKQRTQELKQTKAKVKQLQDQYQQKERDYQALRAETIKVIQGTSHLNVDLLNSLISETEAQLESLKTQMQAAEMELQRKTTESDLVNQEYTQLMDWADLYDNCSIEAKKMILSQFVKAVHVKRGYELDIEFNVSFEEFQTMYLEPDADVHKRKGATDILALVGSDGK